MPRLFMLLALGGGLACSRTEPSSAQAITPPPPSPSPAEWSALVFAVDAMAAEALARGPLAGLSMAVVRDGQTILAKGYGWADREAGLPASPETSYPVASLSKQFTAAAVLQLAERGRLGLDDPLRAFFPPARPAIGALTVRQLLSHTSGLTRGGPAPRSAALSVLRRGGTARPAGADWDYSNYNFSLLGLVIEHVSGRSYADYVRDELAAPLGLTGTGYCEDGTAVAGRTRDYEAGPKGVEPTEYWRQPRFFAAGGLCSTVLDLVKWQRALDEGRVLGATFVEAMRRASRLSDGLEVDYGYGTRLGMTGAHRKLGHTGGGRSNKAVLARYPNQRTTIVVLLNTERTEAEVTATDLEVRIARALFGLPEPVPTGVPLPPEELQRYAGVYRDGARLLRLAPEEGSLQLRADGPRRRRAPASSLIAQGGDVFVDAEDPSVELRFAMGPDQARAYARYHYGWFVGLGVRTAVTAAPKPKTRPKPGRPALRRMSRRTRS